MAETLELDGLNELRAALLEERQTIVASVRKLRDSRRQKGTFVLGDGAAAGPRLVAVTRMRMSSGAALAYSTNTSK